MILYDFSTILSYTLNSLKREFWPIPILITIIALYLSNSIVLLTALTFQKRSRLQQSTLCRSLHAEAIEATLSEGLARGPYIAGRAMFETRPSGRKASSLPIRHHAPQIVTCRGGADGETAQGIQHGDIQRLQKKVNNGQGPH